MGRLMLRRCTCGVGGWGEELERGGSVGRVRGQEEGADVRSSTVDGNRGYAEGITCCITAAVNVCSANSSCQETRETDSKANIGFAFCYASLLTR